MAKNEVTKKEADKSAVPAYLKDNERGTGLQNMGSDDVLVPRVKLLQAISDEVTAFDEAKAGEFWLTVMDKPLGETLEFIVARDRKRYLLLPPRNDARGILARADDAVHWNPPEGEFQVKLKGVAQSVTWTLAATVAESGLAKFGTSNPADPDSPPAATLFYDYLVVLPDFPELGPCMMSFARSQAKRAKDLNSKLAIGEQPIQSKKFLAVPTSEQGDEGPYFNVSFKRNGWATEEEFAFTCDVTERFTDFQAADEDAVAREGTASGEGADAGPPPDDI